MNGSGIHIKEVGLQNTLVVDGNPGNPDLGDLIDAGSIQSLMEDFHALCAVPTALIDLEGRVLVGVGWQEICTKFHRVCAESCKHCIESDTMLTRGVPEGEFRIYQCKNHLRDVVTPVMVNGQHAGNVFTGQFFYDDEIPDRDLFRAQARQYGFDELQYLAALDKVPRFSRQTIDRAMAFLRKLAHVLSVQGFGNLQLARSLIERDAAMRELIRHREWLRVTLSSIGEAVLTTDTNGRVSFMNPVAEALTGWTTGEAMHRPVQSVFRMVDEKTKAPGEDIVGRVMCEGDGLCLTSARILLTRDGWELPIEICAAPMLDAAGHLSGVVLVFRDVTAKRRSETQLRDLNEALERRVQERTAELDGANHTLRMISECNQIMVRVQDEQDLIRQICETIVTFGRFRMAWVGYAEEDERRSVRPIAWVGFEDGYLDRVSITWAEDERGRGPTGTCIRTGEVQVCQDFRSSSGVSPWRDDALERGYRSSIALPLSSGRRVFGALMLYSETPDAFNERHVELLRGMADDLAFGIQALRDRQDRDRALELSEQRANQLRELAVQLTLAERHERQCLAKVLHDQLQQLLVAAKLHAGMVSGRISDPVARGSAVQVEALLGESLEMSRSLTLELSPPILADGGLAQGLAWLARRMLQQHGLQVVVHVCDEAEPADSDVREFLFEAVRELLFNVVKHAGINEARVSLDRTESGRVSVRVADAGVGFESNSEQARECRGTGLGLFGIQQRLEFLGGSLEIDATPGRGVVVTLVAPADQVFEVGAEPVALDDEAPRDSVAPDGSRRIRVLLADDHSILRQGLAALLRGEQDIEVVGEAADGLAAIESCLQLEPDVVVMDISMPEMNGVEATRRILARQPTVRIIGLSMHEHSDMANEMREAGAVDFVTKGGPSEALVGAIRAAAMRVESCTRQVGKGRARRTSRSASRIN